MNDRIPEGKAHVPPQPTLRRSRWHMSPARWLIVAIAAYFVVSFAMSWLRAEELQTTTWDQGLYQQALWMTAHGRPFYETADVETGGYGSLLEVHTTLLLYLVVPLYALFPYETTLFAVQSAVVAAAAVPLYYLARDRVGSPRLALVAALAYLCWTPTLSSNLYDFHAEAFLPIEVFALLLFWTRARYAAGLAVAVTAFLTFEFAPVIVFAVGIFAVIPGALGPSYWSTFRRAFAEHPLHALREWLQVPRVRASLSLAAASLVAYIALLEFRLDLLPTLVGSYPLPSPASGYVIGATPTALGLSLTNLSVGFGAKASYWLIVVGLLAFVPLLAPRALVITAPWFAFTLASTNLNYVTLGFQYGFVAGSTLFVAFVFGLPRARVAVEAWLARPAVAGAPATASRTVPRRRVRGRSIATAGIIGLLAVNLALTPVNPWMQNSGLGSAYRVSYTGWSESRDVGELAQLIPPGATVLTTDNLFPLVANDANAYSFLWSTDPTIALPFSFDHPPTYVFIAEDRTAAVSSWLTEALYDPSVYGVRGVAWLSPAGTVLLFETGFTGPVAEFGPPPPLGGVYAGLPITSDSDGIPAVANGSTFSTVVESVPGELGTVWYGPDSSLAPGNYTVSLSLRLASLPGFPLPNSTTPVLWVGALAFGEPNLWGSSFSFPALDGDSFSNVSFNVQLSAPTIEFDVQGVLLDSSVQVTLNYLEIAPD